jgi:thioesterase domain-containing protein
VQLGHHIRTELKIDLPAHLLLESPTVAALAQRLGSPQPEPDPSRHLVRLASGPGDPLFLVHPVGGHVYFYLPLAKGLDGVAPIYGLQAQGVDGEAPPLGSILEMAASYITAMRKTQPKGPYRIGGASFGGVVAFEIAQQLLGSGETVGLLAMLDSPGPGALPVGFTSNAEILAYLLNHGSTEEVHLMKLSTLSEEEMLRYFLTHGGGRERLPPQADIDSVRHFLRLFRTNFDALLKYHPRPCAASGLFFSALDPDAVNPVGLERAWAPLLQSLEVVPVPGNHTTINLQPNVQIIIDRLRLALARPAV